MDRSGPLDQPDQEQQDHGTHGSRCNRADQSTARADARQSEQVTSDRRADDTDDDIAEETEAAPAHDQSRQPARHRTDQEKNQQALDTHGKTLLKLGKSLDRLYIDSVGNHTIQNGNRKGFSPF